MMEQNQDQTNEVEQEENCPVEENTQDKDREESVKGTAHPKCHF